MNNKTIAIVYHCDDAAGRNISDNLLKMKDWTFHEYNGLGVYEYKNFKIIGTKDPLINQDGLDRKLKNSNLNVDLIVFASKHKSKDERRILTVHFTGNTGDAAYGGRSRELAAAAPQAAKSLLRSLSILSVNEDLEVTLESTHHGPSDMAVPSVFVEIGSTEKEWADSGSGRIVANSILMLSDNDYPVAVGFGGNHYVPRQTKLMLETDVTFGHIFPTHKLDELDENLVGQAFIKSHGDFAYFDRKSMNANQRDRLEGIIKKLGFEILKESDIRDMDGVPWEFCRQLRNKVQELCPNGHARIGNGIRDELRNCCPCPRVKVARINPELLREAETLDKKRLRDFLENRNIAYVESDNGRFSHVIIGLDDDCARLAVEELTSVCIDILKQNYKIEYDRSGGVLYLIEKKFSPELARKYGIESGPLFGQLASGKSVSVNGKTIKPEMVYETIKRGIILKNVYI